MASAKKNICLMPHKSTTWTAMSALPTYKKNKNKIKRQITTPMKVEEPYTSMSTTFTRIH